MKIQNVLEGHNALTQLQFVELPRANADIHKSSPTPLLIKHANELITLSQLMNLHWWQADLSALSIRL